MGVYRLWDILLVAAQSCSVEQLSGYIFAIDASIWLVKANSIFQNEEQILKCMFDKIILLKRNNILPLFVFDGISPMIKRKTLENRRRKRATTNQMEIKKKAQIDIINIISKKNQRQLNNQKQKQVKLYKKQEKYDANIKQMLKIFNNLKQNQQRCSKQISTQQLQKLALQVQVLNQKYELLFQMHPNLRTKFYNEQFFQLDIQSKLEIFQMIEEQKYKTKSLQNKSKKQLTVEQQIFQDMELIEKKSKIRQLQDDLYRKTMKNYTTIKDGYQIVEGIYNGKKVTQSRKIKTADEAFKINSKTKNDFSQILGFNQKNQEELDGQEDKNPDPFFSELFSKKIKKQVDKSEEQNKKSIEIVNLIAPKKEVKNKHLQKINKNQNNSDHVLSEEFSEQEYKIKNNNKTKNKPNAMVITSKDNLPTYQNYHHLQLRNMQQNSGYNYFQNFLDILGISYIVSPGQAEAQCASLEIEGLVDGIITEDSDVFLFGGKNIFRGFFQNNIKFYNMDHINQLLRFTREKMIIFAMLLGSDYTDGIKGIGEVNAMQILKVFDTFQKLKQFKKWAQYADILQNDETNKTEYLSTISEEQLKYFYQFHKKFKNYWYIDQQFPKQSVYNAYINPDIIDKYRLNQIKEKNFIQQKELKLEELKQILSLQMGMNPEQVQHYSYLVSKKFVRKEQKIIKILDKNNQKNNSNIHSKRVQKALKFS